MVPKFLFPVGVENLNFKTMVDVIFQIANSHEDPGVPEVDVPDPEDAE